MIDWTSHDSFSENTITCACDTVFRSHSKFVMSPTPHLETRKPCPSCGRNDGACKSSSDREEYTIGSKS